MDIQLDHEKLARLIANELARGSAAPAWLSPPQLAVYVGLPEKTLEEYRRKGTGPAYSRVGKHVRYNRHDADAWLRSLQP